MPYKKEFLSRMIKPIAFSEIECDKMKVRIGKDRIYIFLYELQDEKYLSDARLERTLGKDLVKSIAQLVCADSENFITCIKLYKDGKIKLSHSSSSVWKETSLALAIEIYNETNLINVFINFSAIKNPRETVKRLLSIL